MIEAEGLTKDFNDFRAVDNFTVRVEAGSVFALLGPNGAGKTTTVRMLTSILRPSAGWARVAGYDVVGQPAQVRANVGVSEPADSNGNWSAAAAVPCGDAKPSGCCDVPGNVRQRCARTTDTN